MRRSGVGIKLAAGTVKLRIRIPEKLRRAAADRGKEAAAGAEELHTAADHTAMPTITEPMPTTMIEMLVLNNAITAKAKIQPNNIEIPNHKRLRFLAIVNIKMLKINMIASEMDKKLSFLTC